MSPQAWRSTTRNRLRNRANPEPSDIQRAGHPFSIPPGLSHSLALFGSTRDTHTAQAQITSDSLRALPYDQCGAKVERDGAAASDLQSGDTWLCGWSRAPLGVDKHPRQLLADDGLGLVDNTIDQNFHCRDVLYQALHLPRAPDAVIAVA